MKEIKFELADYLCIYQDTNGKVDCVLSKSESTTNEIYNSHETATVVRIDSFNSSRSILKQKVDGTKC